MLSWWFNVRRGQNADPECTLATWESRLGGLRWLDDLIAIGKARKLRSDGYPNRYEAACRRRIIACSPDEIITIDAWDQS